MTKSMTLREWMADQKLSQQKLAVMLGVTQPTIARWLNTVQAPDFCNIIKIRKLTGGVVTADSLVDQWEKDDG